MFLSFGFHSSMYRPPQLCRRSNRDTHSHRRTGRDKFEDGVEPFGLDVCISQEPAHGLSTQMVPLVASIWVRDWIRRQRRVALAYEPQGRAVP